MLSRRVKWVLRFRWAARGNKVHDPFGVELCRRQKKRPAVEPSVGAWVLLECLNPREAEKRRDWEKWGRKWKEQKNKKRSRGQCDGDQIKERSGPSATVRYGWAGLAATRERNMGRRLVARIGLMFGASDTLVFMKSGIIGIDLLNERGCKNKKEGAFPKPLLYSTAIAVVKLNFPPTNVRDDIWRLTAHRPPLCCKVATVTPTGTRLLARDSRWMVVQDSCDMDGWGLLRGSRPEWCPPGGAPDCFQWGYIDGWNAVRDSHRVGGPTTTRERDDGSGA